VQRSNRPSRDRYILAAAVSLTPGNKKALAEIIGPVVKSLYDILGYEDHTSLLREHDDVAKGHVKPWLSATAALERLLHPATPRLAPNDPGTKKRGPANMRAMFVGLSWSGPRWRSQSGRNCESK